MNLPRSWHRPEVLWLLAAAVLALLIAAWTLGFVVTKYRAATTQIADIDPRYAQLAGMQHNQNAFAQDGERLEANLAEFVYAADQDASQIANTALSQVRELAAQHQLSVTSSQTAAPREEDGFERIGINLRVEGEWDDIVALLGELGAQQPSIYTATLQLGARARGAQGTAPLVFTQLDLYVLKEARP